MIADRQTDTGKAQSTVTIAIDIHCLLDYEKEACNIIWSSEKWDLEQRDPGSNPPLITELSG